jgi:murein DD-endopeptidase MepM/ murein hydrolase activator NlpD
MSPTTQTPTRAPSSVSRGRSLRRFLVAMAFAASVVAVDVLRGETGARAVDYPSWDDVLAARGSESAKAAEVSRIQDLIGSLQAEVAAAQALAMQRADEYSRAQEAYDTAVFRSGELASQADEARAAADASNRQAGLLISQFVRTGSGDITVNLLVSGDGSSDMLYQLGAMSQLSQKTIRLHEKAAQDRNTADALTAQADVAASELDGLRIAAEQAFVAAQEAQAASEAALVVQEAQQIVLEEQLKALTDATAKTEAEYQAGVEERRRQEEAARAAAAAAAAAAGNRGGGGSGGGGSYSVGPGGQGWSNPFPGSVVSDEWGQRFHPIYSEWRLHAGIDLVYGGGRTCGATVYASASGTVTQAGYNGGLGNSVTISHGNGWTTVYGHNTSVLVGRGSSVGEGQPIAYAGTTGASTGCHLHFETRTGGTSQNPRSLLGPLGVTF